MMRLRTYAGLSLVATLAVIYHAFNSRGQFYPAMVYLSTFKISLVLLLNMGLVVMCILWQLTKRLFLGSLREAEVERLNEQSWREVMEILFAITIFRQDFSVTFLAMVTVLLLIKALHWLAQKRVEYIETTPSVPLLSHIRIVSFLGFLLLLDCLFFYSAIKFLIQTRQASVSLFFSFEYMILATTTVSAFVKYVFYVSDMLMEGQWEKKAVYTFYLELIRDLLHLSMYLCFFLVIFMNYGVPLHLIRELYETFRNFKIRIADFMRYRKITSNMNDRFPDATPEELNASDATCIICREDMTTAKKLICGHLFHVHCLRSWLERQHTCPTCRALVVPPENGTSSSGGQHGSRSDAHQQGLLDMLYFPRLMGHWLTPPRWTLVGKEHPLDKNSLPFLVDMQTCPFRNSHIVFLSLSNYLVPMETQERDQVVIRIFQILSWKLRRRLFSSGLRYHFCSVLVLFLLFLSNCVFQNFEKQSLLNFFCPTLGYTCFSSSGLQ
ncbi:hypothetical protein CRYUN_Cryun03dG0131500 [Craigia yunnanensis]